MDKYTLKGSLSETLDGIIWKIETDSKLPLIAVETRHPDTRSATFSVFNYQSGHCTYRNANIDDSWHWNLDKIYNGILLLHSYLHESTPEHTGIIALDKQGNMAWQLFNRTLFELAEEGLIVYDPKIAPKKLELAALETGNLGGLDKTSYTSLMGSIEIPDVLDDYAQYKPFMKGLVQGPVFYKCLNGKSILAYHTKKENLFSQQLTVIQDGAIVLHDILDEGIQKMNPEAFFIDHGYLFYIRRKQELVSYFV